MTDKQITPPRNAQASNQANRIPWLDVSRGLAFLMVIYSHLDFCNDTIMRYFSPVFLTTFFFVSGYLFKEGYSFSKVLEQRTRTLFLPFLQLGLIMIVMSQIMTFKEKVPFFDHVVGLLSQNGENQLLWFVAALYVYSIIFFWIEKISHGATGLLIISFLLFLLNRLAIEMGLPRIPWHLASFGYACFYMGLGKYYKEKEDVINRIIDNKWFVLLMAIWYVLIISIFDLRISYAGGKFVFDAWCLTIPGLVVMIFLSRRLLQNNRLLLFVGANSLFYFAFHGKIFSVLQAICYKVVPESMSAIFGFYDLIAFIIVIFDALILIIPAMFVNRYCPFLLGKGFKLWKAK